MVAEGSVCEKGRKNGTGHEVCGRKVAVETNIFWYTLDNTSKTNSASHGGSKEVCCGNTTKKAEAVDGPGIQRPFPFALRVPFEGAPESQDLNRENEIGQSPNEGGY
jgi:hypothetical protein